MQQKIKWDDVEFMQKCLFLNDQDQHKLFSINQHSTQTHNKRWYKICSVISLIILAGSIASLIYSNTATKGYMATLTVKKLAVLIIIYDVIFICVLISISFDDFLNKYNAPRPYDLSYADANDFMKKIYTNDCDYLNDWNFAYGFKDDVEIMYQFGWLCNRKAEMNELLDKAIKLQKATAYLNDWDLIKSLPEQQQKQINDAYLKHYDEFKLKLYNLVKPDIDVIHLRAIELKIPAVLNGKEKQQISSNKGKEILNEIK